MAIPKSLQPSKNWQEVFLRELANIPNITQAAKKARISRRMAYNEREKNPEFAVAWDDAIDQAIEIAEGELYRRGVKGTLEPVYQRGARVGNIRRFSDNLLMFMLRHQKPERYRETIRSELSGPDREPIQIVDLSKLTTDELLALRQLTAKITTNDSTD